MLYNAGDMSVCILVDFVKVRNLQLDFLTYQITVRIQITDDVTFIVKLLYNERQCAFRFFLRYAAFNRLRDGQLAKILRIRVGQRDRLGFVLHDRRSAFRHTRRRQAVITDQRSGIRLLHGVNRTHRDVLNQVLAILEVRVRDIRIRCAVIDREAQAAHVRTGRHAFERLRDLQTAHILRIVIHQLGLRYRILGGCCRRCRRICRYSAAVHCQAVSVCLDTALGEGDLRTGRYIFNRPGVRICTGRVCYSKHFVIVAVCNLEACRQAIQSAKRLRNLHACCLACVGENCTLSSHNNYSSIARHYSIESIIGCFIDCKTYTSRQIRCCLPVSILQFESSYTVLKSHLTELTIDRGIIQSHCKLKLNISMVSWNTTYNSLANFQITSIVCVRNRVAAGLTDRITDTRFQRMARRILSYLYRRRYDLLRKVHSGYRRVAPRLPDLIHICTGLIERDRSERFICALCSRTRIHVDRRRQRCCGRHRDRRDRRRFVRLRRADRTDAEAIVRLGHVRYIITVDRFLHRGLCGCLMIGIDDRQRFRLCNLGRRCARSIRDCPCQRRIGVVPCHNYLHIPRGCVVVHVFNHRIVSLLCY